MAKDKTLDEVETQINCATSVIYPAEGSVNARIQHDMHAAGMHLLRALNLIPLNEGSMWKDLWEVYLALSRVQDAN